MPRTPESSHQDNWKKLVVVDLILSYTNSLVSSGNTPELNRKPHPTTVNFDPEVQDPKSKLTRDPTPYPKELHVKALQWRAAREEGAAAHSQDKSAVATNVPLRNGSRSRSIHRPYSLIRAMSDPIEPGDLVGAGSGRPSSRRRERSHEKREMSQSPARITPGATPVIKDRRSYREERPVSYCSSPSPPPLAVPAYYSPGHNRHQISEEAEWLIEQQPNGTRGAAAGVPHYPTPQQASPGGNELHTALLASNSNSNNNNNNNNRRMASTSPPPRLPPSSASRLAIKSNTYPPSQPTSHSTTTFSRPPSASGQSHLQSTPHAQSEASTLSHSDTANPRYSSSLESGFDADVEQDKVYWYMTETSPGDQQPLIQLQQFARLPGAQRRRFMSDSTAASGRASSAPRCIRRGSADDYDHLERCLRADAGASRQMYSSSCSPVAHDPRAHQLATRHQKASRSFDVAELPTGPLSAVETRPSGARGPQPVSFTAAAKAARNVHSRSKSDPDDLIAIEKATPINGHAHRSARGSLSPTPVNPYFVNVNMGGDIPGSSSHSNQPFPLISPVSNSAYQRLTGHGRKRGGADHTPHQRYPSSSDESHSRGGGGAEPEEQATPKSPSKVNSTHTYEKCKCTFYDCSHAILCYINASASLCYV